MARNKVEISGINTKDIIVLTNEEMQQLFIRKNEGDLYARDLLAQGNLKLVLSILRKFSNREENLDDLFQIGCIGLMKAIDNFDMNFNVKFSTYAVPMIIGEIKRHLRDNSSIKVSRSYKDLAYKALAYKDEFQRKNHREPSIEEIAAFLEAKSMDVVLALEAIQDTISMSTPIYDNGGDIIELEDQIGSDDQIMENWAKNQMIKEAFSRLNEREKRIIYHRYYEDKTQSEIALELNISQAQVSRLEKNALKIMHESFN